jgi:hypothetical protein
LAEQGSGAPTLGLDDDTEAETPRMTIDGCRCTAKRGTDRAVGGCRAQEGDDGTGRGGARPAAGQQRDDRWKIRGRDTPVAVDVGSRAAHQGAVGDVGDVRVIAVGQLELEVLQVPRGDDPVAIGVTG